MLVSLTDLRLIERPKVSEVGKKQGQMMRRFKQECVCVCERMRVREDREKVCVKKSENREIEEREIEEEENETIEKNEKERVESD